MVVDTRPETTPTPVEHPSRLTAFGMTGVDWVLVGVGIMLTGALFVTVAGLGDADVVAVFMRLLPPVTLAAMGAVIFQVARPFLVARGSWMTIGVGLGILGAGSAIRGLDELGVYEPMPGLDRVVTLGGLAVVAAGVVMIPRLVGIRHTSRRAAMDALAGGAAVGALLWEPVRRAIRPVDGLDLALEIATTSVHALAAAACIYTLMRQSRYRTDTPFRALAVAVAIIVTAGVAHQLRPGAGFDSQLVPSIEVLAAIPLVLVILTVRERRTVRSAITGRPPIWKFAVAYVPVAGMVAVTFHGLLTDPSDLGVLPMGLVVVTTASWFSQVAAAKENRALVGMERDQLITALSHELRSPLTAVTGFSSVLAARWDALADEEREEMIGIINDQSSSLSGLITDMTSLVRGQLHAVELVVGRHDAKAVVADAVRAVFADNQGPLPVTTQLEPYLEVVADRARLQQALVSLLKNARRYGGGRIVVEGHRDGDHRVIEVHDDGPGLSAQYEETVWDRFERGENDLNAHVPGSGLGLSMVRSIAIAHGGSASYRRSEKLGGACFSITLPTRRPAERGR